MNTRKRIEEILENTIGAVENEYGENIEYREHLYDQLENLIKEEREKGYKQGYSAACYRDRKQPPVSIVEAKLRALKKKWTK